MQNTKRARFVRLAESRTEAVIERLRVLGNCANPQAYDWTQGDMRQIFGAIRAELDRVEHRFQDKFRSRAGFHLTESVSEDEAVRSHMPLKAEDRSPDVVVLSDEPALSDRAPSSFRYPGPTVSPESPVEFDLSQVQRLPVPGHERSQIDVRLSTAPGWYVRAKDKGHRLGYVLHLFGPDSVEHARRDTGRGSKRHDAVQMAARMIYEAAASEMGVQLTLVAL